MIKETLSQGGSYLKIIQLKEPVKIDLGCGRRKKKGFFGFDMKKDSDADYVCDLSKGIPLADNSVDEIYTSHFLEHLEDYNFMMQEMVRVGKNGARIEIILPYYTYIGAPLHSYWDNPHRQVFSEAYFIESYINPCFNKYKIEKMDYKFIKYRVIRKNIFKMFFCFVYNFLIPKIIKRRHIINSIEEFKVVLRVKN